MNLTRVLNNALPEMPARILSQRLPKVPPEAVSKEIVEDGNLIVRVYLPSLQLLYKFPPANWALIQLFDGRRTYEEIAQLYSAQLGAEYSVEDVRELAGALESTGFWYKTTQEKNVQLMQMGAEERRKLLKSRKSKFGDLSEIAFPAINPDKFITWLYSYTSFIYTWWFTLLTVGAFLITAVISITHWSEIGRDTLEFFSFTDKTWGDFGVFYLLALLTLCWHETAHAHACKHYGGRVPAMGFLLIYLTPAFYTDTTEGFVKGTRLQRFIIAMAGAHAELLLCAVATPIWWGTAPGTNVHNAAYFLMLMTGIAGVLLNWNPLMKLDGYHMLCEVVGIADLKEDSTAYVSAWVKRHIWGLPVDVPYVPKQRRFGFVVYALLSGVYSYTVLYVVAHFVGNIFRNFNPEWSFVPELGTAFLIFRSRLRTFGNFMKFVYLDKKDRIQAMIGRWQSKAAGAGILLLIFLPLWRDNATGRFVLEPAKQAVVRAMVPGKITDVLVNEGTEVEAGTPLVRMRNVSLQSKVSESEADYSVASMKVNEASLHYANLGVALMDQERLKRQSHELKKLASSLELSSPISGVLLTSRLADRVGTYIPDGTELAEIGDLSCMRARIYISEHDVSKIQVAALARVQVAGIAKKWDARALEVAPVSSGIAPELAEKSKYTGLNPLNYYVVDLVIDNPARILKPGMVGTARIYGRRSSLVELAGREVIEFFGRKAW
jgi:putative peptide zinc metalloprotease protein